MGRRTEGDGDEYHPAVTMNVICDITKLNVRKKIYIGEKN